VHNHDEGGRAIQIGLLQRHALDHAHFSEHPLRRGAATGRQIAIVGAGPAGLSCAHQLAMLGNDVIVFEAKTKPGGLNEFGVARYKLTDHYAQQEIEFLLQIGGIKMQYGQQLGLNLHLTELTTQFDAVFLASGLSQARRLELDDEQSPGMLAALDTISVLRQTEDLTQLPVPKSCLILGAGNTAIDMAVQIRLMGAQQVTLVYRRGEQDIPATAMGLQLALQHRVQLICWAQPVTVLLNPEHQVRGMRFEKTAMVNKRLLPTGTTFDLSADAIFKAVGQQLDTSMCPENSLRLEHGKIWVDANFQTSVPGVYAGGDCVLPDPDLTVVAVQHGKLAARAIHRSFQRGQHG